MVEESSNNRPPFVPEKPDIGMTIGCHFEPTDEELVVNYLKPKACNQPLPRNNIIKEVDLYSDSPDAITKSKDPNNETERGVKEWYFFTPRERKYPNSVRAKRKAGDGFWKGGGVDKKVKIGGKIVGLKKPLGYYIYISDNGKKKKKNTNWKMHEYVLSDTPPRQRTGVDDMRLDDWVLCRIYKTNKTLKDAPDSSESDHDDKKLQEAEIHVMPDNNATPLQAEMTMGQNCGNILPRGTRIEQFHHVGDYNNMHMLPHDHQQAYYGIGNDNGYGASSSTSGFMRFSQSSSLDGFMEFPQSSSDLTSVPLDPAPMSSSVPSIPRPPSQFEGMEQNCGNVLPPGTRIEQFHHHGDYNNMHMLPHDHQQAYYGIGNDNGYGASTSTSGLMGFSQSSSFDGFMEFPQWSSDLTSVPLDPAPISSSIPSIPRPPSQFEGMEQNCGNILPPGTRIEQFHHHGDYNNMHMLPHDHQQAYYGIGNGNGYGASTSTSGLMGFSQSSSFDGFMENPRWSSDRTSVPLPATMSSSIPSIPRPPSQFEGMEQNCGNILPPGTRIEQFHQVGDYNNMHMLPHHQQAYYGNGNDNGYGASTSTTGLMGFSQSSFFDGFMEFPQWSSDLTSVPLPAPMSSSIPSFPRSPSQFEGMEQKYCGNILPPGARIEQFHQIGDYNNMHMLPHDQQAYNGNGNDNEYGASTSTYGLMEFPQSSLDLTSVRLDPAPMSSSIPSIPPPTPSQFEGMGQYPQQQPPSRPEFSG